MRNGQQYMHASRAIGRDADAGFKRQIMPWAKLPRSIREKHGREKQGGIHVQPL